MRAPTARAKILGYFAQKQRVTSPFSNSEWGQLPQVALPLRLPGLARRPPETDKFGYFPILEKTHIMTGKLAFYDALLLD